MLRAIIVEDEQHARQDLLNALSLLNGEIKILAEYSSPVEALANIHSLKPDLLFLDVEMPQMSGFELLKALGENIPFQVIFVTGYDKYALKAFEFSAVDYLLKPVIPDALVAAIAKAKERVDEHLLAKQYSNFLHNLKETNLNLRTLALPTHEGLAFVRICDIIRCDADGNYTSVALIGKASVLVSRTLKEFEKLLSDLLFMRVHNSHIINLNHIKRYVKGEGGYAVMTDDSTIEISRTKKEEFLNAFMKV